MQHASFLYGNMPLHYVVAGEGPAVLFLHGFGEDHSIWGNIVRQCSGFCRCIAPDLPGTGESIFNPDLNSIEDYAEAIRALLDRLAITECVMIGHSMGGYITLAFAEKYGDMLKGMGLIHSTAFPDSAEKREARTKSIDFIKKNGARLFLKQTTPNLFTETFRNTYPDQVQAVIETTSGIADATLIQYYESMMKRPDRTEVLKKAKYPVFFLVGQHDLAVPYADSMKQVYLPEISYVHILKSSAHMGMIEQKDETQASLEKFLRDIAVHTEERPKDAE